MRKFSGTAAGWLTGLGGGFVIGGLAIMSIENPVARMVLMFLALGVALIGRFGRGSGRDEDLFVAPASRSSWETAPGIVPAASDGDSDETARGKPTLSGLGRRVEEILALAGEQAADRKIEAEREAQRILDEARREARSILDSARDRTAGYEPL